MQDMREKRYIVFSFHLHLVFIYILVCILALLLEMSKSLSRLISGTSPGIYANYYKISIYLKRNFMSLYPAPEESGFYGHVDKIPDIGKGHLVIGEEAVGIQNPGRYGKIKPGIFQGIDEFSK